LKILDFGISKLLSPEQPVGELTETGVVMGSPKYMSPEQFGTAASADTRSDVWALGTILYEMLAGEPAFNEPTLARVCARVTSGEPPPSLCALRSDVPEALERAIFSTLALDREERTQDVAQLAREILEAIGDPDAVARADAIRATLGEPGSGQIPSGPRELPATRPRLVSRSGGRRFVVTPPPRPRPFAKRAVGAGVALLVCGAAVWLFARSAREHGPVAEPATRVSAAPPVAPEPSPVAPPISSPVAVAPPTSAVATAPAPVPSAAPATSSRPQKPSLTHPRARPSAVSSSAPAAETPKPVAAAPAPPAAPPPAAPSVSPADLGTYR
jgi:serine/threonine-protein kinase